jgi:uncharacterized membrane protein
MTMTAEAIRRLEESQGLAHGVNVGESERLISELGGALMLTYGLSRGSWRGTALAIMGGALLYRGITGHSALYEALGIDTFDGKDWLLAGPDVYRGVKVVRSATIKRSPEECYRFWRNLRNLPRFATYLISVEVIDERRSHWLARAPAPWDQVEWDAEIITDKPNQRIAWRSLRDADVPNAGSVGFRPAPGNRGTEVTVELSFEPPAGRLGLTLVRLFGEDPRRALADTLLHFKQIMETGEILIAWPGSSGRETSR